MSIVERVVYKRITIKCDNCGIEENVVRVVDSERDSLPPRFGWITLPLASFARDEQHAHNRACADAIAKRALDDADRSRVA